jgi:hypothetical protein
VNKNRTAPTPPRADDRHHVECGLCGRLVPVTRFGIACRCDPRVQAAIAARKKAA